MTVAPSAAGSIYYTGDGGWDFEKTWTMIDGENGGYPVLKIFHPDEGGISTMLLIGIAVVAIACVGAAVYYFVFMKKPPAKPPEDAPKKHSPRRSGKR
jgi:hypothetical protein